MKIVDHIGDLKPDPRNARCHNPRNLGMIEDILPEGGAKQLIECHLRDGLALVLNGKTEVKLRYGKADVVTATHVYEVKEMKDWKHAIGQAIIYSLEGGLKPGIAVFGPKTPINNIKIISEVCQRLGIDLLFHFWDADNLTEKDLDELDLSQLAIPVGLPDMAFEIRTIRWVKDVPQN